MSEGHVSELWAAAQNAADSWKHLRYGPFSAESELRNCVMVPRDLCWNLFGAVSGWIRILDQAARSIGLSASFWVSVSHPSTLRMVI